MRKKLPGWLILLIVLIGPLQLSGAARNLSTISDSYRPFLSQYPSLSNSLMIYQLLVGASTAIWLYTAWILFQREPGTLARAQTSFLIGAGLRIFSFYSLALFSGFPAEISQDMFIKSVSNSVIAGGMITVWYSYLVRSKRVRDVFTE